MAAEIKRYGIDFFTGHVADDADATVGEILAGFAEAGHGPVWEQGSYTYDLRGVRQAGQVVRGVLAKFRTDQIPHAGLPGGRERELDLVENEGLIDKNYFLFDMRYNLLIYQRNGQASRSQKLAQYLTDQCGETITFDPVLQPNAAQRLMRAGVEPLALELSFARPTNPDMYPGDDWDRSLIRLANEAGGARVSIRISSDRRSGDEDRQRLTDRMRNAVNGFVDAGLASVARMKVINEGMEHPIDLIADRLQSYQSVVMAGRYPLPEAMYGALRNAFEEERDAIDAVLGRPGRRLR